MVGSKMVGDFSEMKQDNFDGIWVINELKNGQLHISHDCIWFRVYFEHISFQFNY